MEFEIHATSSDSFSTRNFAKVTGTVLSFCMKSNYIPIETNSEFLILLQEQFYTENKTSPKINLHVTLGNLDGR